MSQGGPRERPARHSQAAEAVSEVAGVAFCTWITNDLREGQTQSSKLVTIPQSATQESAEIRHLSEVFMCHWAVQDAPTTQ